MSLLAINFALLATTGLGDCTPAWSDRFYAADFESAVNALCSFPGPQGPRVFAGGMSHVNGEPSEDIAWWDGAQWHPLEAGTSRVVLEMAVFDDGAGDALYVGGTMNQAGGVTINGIGRWREGEWSALADGVGPNGVVYAIDGFDDGNGASLYVGGFFVIGDAARVARWDGVAWQPVGNLVLDDGVYDMTVFDDGAGPALWVCGRFEEFVLGAPADRVAKWDGETWTGIVGGLGGTAKAIEVFDNALYVGGKLTLEGEDAALVRWTGAAWERVDGFDAEILTLLAFDDGHGPALYAGGLPVDGIEPGLRRWDGAQWDDVDGGPNEAVVTLVAHEQDGQSSLFAAGGFSAAGAVPAARVASWDGAAWSAPGTENVGNAVSLHVGVFDLQPIDDEVVGIEPPALAVVGAFNLRGADRVNGVATWDGSAWGCLADGVPGASQLSTVAAFGAPPERFLYVANRDLHRWDGQAWIAERLGIVGSVNVLEELVLDGEGALYAGGLLHEIDGVKVEGIAKFDGEQWSPLGAGVDSRVWAAAVFDDGAGEAIYVGGTFDEAGGVSAVGIARWRDETWTAVGGSVDGNVYALHVHDGALFVGGNFEQAGVVPASNVARWDGAAWAALGPGVDDSVWSLATADDGHGPALYAGGRFDAAGGLTVNHVARWDGSAWEALDDGVDGTVWSLASIDDRAGPGLYVGGSIFEAGTLESRGLGRWGCATCRGDVDGDGAVSFDDLLAVLSDWGPCSGCEADLNADGRVAFDDLLIVLGAWGACE